MAIGRHRDMESLVDLCHCAIDMHQQAIGRWIGYAETLRSRELLHSLVILFRRAKLLCELSHSKKMSVIGAGWVIKPFQQVRQFALIAKRQNDRKPHALIL